MRLLDVAIDDDLAPFSRHLWVQRIAHRVYEESGRQILELARADDAQRAQADYEAWRSGALALVHPADVPQQESRLRASPWRRLPVVMAMIGLAALIYFFTGGGRLDVGLSNWLAFTDLQRLGDDLNGVIARLEWWRLVTPALLHFSIPHLLFNCAVIWEVGRRIETAEGSMRLLVLAVLLSLASNLAQYWIGGNPRFGGLSGVAYGFVGFVLVRSKLSPAEPLWHLPNGVAVGLLIFLVLFSTGITEPFGLRVANGAHWGGLLSGAVLALIFARLLRQRYTPPDFDR
ncbi:MAG: rhomboid family intramembrane serine protease [Pseudomonadales bacterium]